ncbi:hypothetical protein AB3R30_19480 [Leptolyngbyaceae cyanobacterium UHCC 1019]
MPALRLYSFLLERSRFGGMKHLGKRVGDRPSILVRMLHSYKYLYILNSL